MRRPTRPRTTFGPRFYPNPIEREAEACIERCMAKLGLRELPLPVPVDVWVEGPFGITLGIEDLSHLGPKVLGAAFVAEREMLISDTLQGNDGRFRFTCAHELGHFVLHGSLDRAFRDTSAEPAAGGQGTSLHEREADRFAAAFLMPAESVVRLLFPICSAHGLDPVAMRKWVLAGSEEASAFVRQVLAPAVVRQFDVSTAAALFRLQEILTPDVGPYMTTARPPILAAQRR